MHRNILVFVAMLSCLFLAAQPDTSPAAKKADADFNRLIVDDIKTQKLSSIYKYLQPAHGFDTVKLGQTFSRYSTQTSDTLYSIISQNRGWVQNGDKIWESTYNNSWKVDGDEKFSIEIWFYKKNNSFVIERIIFDSKIKSLLSPETRTADSLNTIVCNRIKHNDVNGVLELFTPGIKISKGELSKTVKAYAAVISDSTLEFNNYSGLSREEFPNPSPTSQVWSGSVGNRWAREGYVTVADIEVTFTISNGKCLVNKIEFTATDNKLQSIAFPGGPISNDLLLLPPPPPPPPGH